MTLIQHLRRLTARLRRQRAPHTVLITHRQLPGDWPPTAVRTDLSTDDLRLALLYLQFLEMDLLLAAGRGGGLFPSGFAELLRLRPRGSNGTANRHIALFIRAAHHRGHVRVAARPVSPPPPG